MAPAALCFGALPLSNITLLLLIAIPGARPDTENGGVLVFQLV